jgi:hypothetical protein
VAVRAGALGASLTTGWVEPGAEGRGGGAAPAIVTLVEPGVHGAEVAGRQGCGVRTPAAAAVAAATCGLSGEEHIPKDAMFTSGSVS